MNKKPTPQTIEVYQSLIQKAVRRGNFAAITEATNFLIEAGELPWLRNRLAILTFEECWPYGMKVSYPTDKKKILSHLLTLATLVKNRNAAGLGSLAYRLSTGDESVLSGTIRDFEIHFIHAAIRNPPKFWRWANNQALNARQKAFIKNAREAFRRATEPWDKSFTIAGAFLGITGRIPQTKKAKSTSALSLAMWVATDMHTAKGRVIISKAAKAIRLNPKHAMWLTFYMEGARCNEITDSPWWEREKEWRMRSMGMTGKQAEVMWRKVRRLLEVTGKR